VIRDSLSYRSRIHGMPKHNPKHCAHKRVHAHMARKLPDDAAVQYLH
jgi:hypothetical protein